MWKWIDYIIVKLSIFKKCIDSFFGIVDGVVVCVEDLVLIVWKSKIK